MLRGMGLSDEQINAILEGHKESLDHYQGEADKYKTQAEESQKKLDKVQKDLDKLKEETEKSDEKNPYKVKYDALKEEFESFKKDVSTKETRSAKEEAYKALLKECGVSEKRINSVVKVSDIDSIEFDEEGKVKDADALKKSIKDEWSDFITTEGTQGASTSTPPGNTGGKMSKEEILAIKDTAQRQQAMLEHKDMFLN
jgi:predicted nuclease with TOPRIM domain